MLTGWESASAATPCHLQLCWLPLGSWLLQQQALVELSPSVNIRAEPYALNVYGPDGESDSGVLVLGEHYSACAIVGCR